MKKLEALAKFLDCECDEIDREGEDNVYHFRDEEYLVLTDEEADQAVGDYVKNTLWAFKPSFLSCYMPLSEEGIRKLQELCEDGNEALCRLVGDRIDELVNDAIASDGRGHFLALYDDKENEEGEYFIYRTN